LISYNPQINHNYIKRSNIQPQHVTGIKYDINNLKCKKFKYENRIE